MAIPPIGASGGPTGVSFTSKVPVACTSAMAWVLIDEGVASVAPKPSVAGPKARKIKRADRQNTAIVCPASATSGNGQSHRLGTALPPRADTSTGPTDGSGATPGTNLN